VVDAAVSPLEHQQIEVTRSATITYWHRVRFELVIREARALGGDRVLDIGAGSGLLGEWIAAHHPNIGYSFAESSPVLREHLIQRFGAGAVDEAATPIPAGTVVTMLDVIEHVEDDHGMLGDLRRRMAPGSHVIVTVPAMQWAYSSWDAGLGHFRRYSRRTLRETLAEAGFDVRSTAYLFPELSPLLVVRKLRRAPREQHDFPVLGRRVNEAGYRVALITTAARRIWPCGTSVVSVASRRP
jgi:hypothetical protein